MRDPRPVEPVGRFSLLVRGDTFKGLGVDGFITPARDERRHSADRKSAPFVTRTDQKLCVGAHYRRSHRHRVPVRQDIVGPSTAEVFDQAEEVVPTTAFNPEACSFNSKRISSISNAAGIVSISTVARIVPRNPESLFGVDENLAPQPRLQMALHLGQVVVRPASPVDKTLRVIEEVDPEIEQSSHNRLVADQSVALVEVPPPRSHDHSCRSFRSDDVLLAFVAHEGYGLVCRVDEVDVSLHQVAPRGRVGILEVREPYACARVESVDRHLAFRRACYLDPPVAQVRRCVCNAPLRLAHLASLREEVQHLSVRHGVTLLLTPLQQRVPCGPEASLEIRDELERRR